ncbi:MAG: hypothetical protein JW990_05550, partial [Thermoleophilia bacterium]|nr:hypothetical protein [Thermoleophilia bacterium]
PPQGPAGRSSRTGLVLGIVAAAIVVLAGIGVGVYFGFLRDGDDGQTAGNGTVTTRTSSTETDGTGTTDSESSTTTATTGQTTSSGAGTDSTVPGGNTAQTIPSLGSSTTGGNTSTSRTTTTEDAYMVYLDAASELVFDLEACDLRIPELATEINNTLPDVDEWVYQDLQDMIDTLLEDGERMLYLDVPPEFREANDHLDAATTSMINRITFTMTGIEELWRTGNRNAGNSYFESGRVERDRYRSEIQKYHETLPVS